MSHPQIGRRYFPAIGSRLDERTFLRNSLAVGIKEVATIARHAGVSLDCSFTRCITMLLMPWLQDRTLQFLIPLKHSTEVAVRHSEQKDAYRVTSPRTHDIWTTTFVLRYLVCVCLGRPSSLGD